MHAARWRWPKRFLRRKQNMYNQNTLNENETKRNETGKKWISSFFSASYDFNLRSHYNDSIQQWLKYLCKRKFLWMLFIRKKRSRLRPCRHFMQENNHFELKNKTKSKSTLIAGCCEAINYYDSHFRSIRSNGFFFQWNIQKRQIR